MIVEHWHQLTRAIDNGVPCYNPIQTPPFGTEGRCGDCDGCRDHGKIEEALMEVEADIEKALDEAGQSK